jgi:membrane protein implicated in regulation of membrane protease activity
MNRHTPIDPRGMQFNAALASVVLALVLATVTTPVGVVLLAVQVALFGAAVVLGVQRTPAAALFRRYVRPQLGPPAYLEDPRPPRFAQGIGFLFTAVGLVGFLTGSAVLGYAAVALALVAALLNATVQVCLGCKIYGICHLPQDPHQNLQHDNPTRPGTITHQKETIA